MSQNIDSLRDFCETYSGLKNLVWQLKSWAAEPDHFVRSSMRKKQASGILFQIFSLQEMLGTFKTPEDHPEGQQGVGSLVESVGFVGKRQAYRLLHNLNKLRSLKNSDGESAVRKEKPRGTPGRGHGRERIPGLTQMYSLDPAVSDALKLDREAVMREAGWSEDQMKLLDEVSDELAIEMYWFTISLIACKTFPKWYSWLIGPRDQAGKETKQIMNKFPTLQEQDLKVFREITRADIEAAFRAAAARKTESK